MCNAAVPKADALMCIVCNKEISCRRQFNCTTNPYPFWQHLLSKCNIEPHPTTATLQKWTGEWQGDGTEPSSHMPSRLAPWRLEAEESRMQTEVEEASASSRPLAHRRLAPDPEPDVLSPVPPTSSPPEHLLKNVGRVVPARRSRTPPKKSMQAPNQRQTLCSVYNGVPICKRSNDSRGCTAREQDCPRQRAHVCDVEVNGEACGSREHARNACPHRV